MKRRLGRWACAITGLIAALPGSALAAGDRLPPGITARESADGLTLSTAQGEPLYRLDLDRSRRRAHIAKLLEARCADICSQLWRPVAPPNGFAAEGDWGLAQRETGPQLTYKGDPLYSFIGKSLEEAAKIQVAPPYFSSYSAKPTLIVDGVPVATLYWHPALYQPAAPKVSGPGGVGTRWNKVAYVFADAENRTLYTRESGRPCPGGCDGLKPFAAPLAAQTVGDWRPAPGQDGERRWTYRGRVVYQPTDAGTAPGADWRPIQVR